MEDVNNLLLNKNQVTKWYLKNGGFLVKNYTCICKKKLKVDMPKYD